MGKVGQFWVGIFREYVKIDDENKRNRLDLMGYSVFVIRHEEDLREQIIELARIIGGGW